MPRLIQGCRKGKKTDRSQESRRRRIQLQTACSRGIRARLLKTAPLCAWRAAYRGAAANVRANVLRLRGARTAAQRAGRACRGRAMPCMRHGMRTCMRTPRARARAHRHASTTATHTRTSGTAYTMRCQAGHTTRTRMCAESSSLLDGEAPCRDSRAGWYILPIDLLHQPIYVIGAIKVRVDTFETRHT